MIYLKHNNISEESLWTKNAVATETKAKLKAIIDTYQFNDKDSVINFNQCDKSSPTQENDISNLTNDKSIDNYTLM